MIIDKEKVKKIAHLARLEFNEQDEVVLVESMNKILDWMEKLNEVDTGNVEPLRHMSQEVNVLRDDAVGTPIGHKEALYNAPHKDSDYFRVPKVLE
ncbi:MAG TPA: Asp-tRNA(Asn)/Glu-tRNA(Gln) amidotransferase subunit GatC [Cytophagales bacterium]|nr:Asp-tRNA(Asn)/Glu-tRNA(Gln) amidotransferase subunit GatC [Cytophagales bacterium]